jgi:polyisoprenoid-binding protein YceI
MSTKKKWILDPTHSEVGFKVRHMMISNVAGVFHEASATVLASEADFSDAEIEFDANIASIDTGNAQRDEHLASAEFFDAATHPTMRFVSTSFVKNEGGDYSFQGLLNIRGNERPIALHVEYAGTVVDPYGQTKAGFDIQGKISRTEYGLTWNAVTEAGGVVVSDEVKLSLSIQVVLQA